MDDVNAEQSEGRRLHDPHEVLQTGDPTDAHLESPWGAAMYHYVQGARAVIEMIVERFRERGRDFHDADTLIFPLGLQCRHLVELRLKELYEVLASELAPWNHQLLDLWRRVRPLIEARWPTSNRSSSDRYGHLPREILEELGIVLRTEGELDRAESLIAALDEIDPRGLSFRYPGTIPAHIKTASVEAIAETALELDEFLDGCLIGVLEANWMRAEMEAECRAECQSE